MRSRMLRFAGMCGSPLWLMTKVDGLASTGGEQHIKTSVDLCKKSIYTLGPVMSIITLHKVGPRTSTSITVTYVDCMRYCMQIEF